MPRIDSWYPGHLRELTDAECRELLAEARVGRFAWCSSEGPVVLPVNYALDGEGIVIRTSASSDLARSFSPGTKAFEIDEYDSYTQSGWSVLARGHARLLDPHGLPDTDDQSLPWAEGERDLYIRLDATRLTGRRVLGS